MTQPIRTKWHHIWPLLKQNEVYFTSPPDEKALPYDSLGGNIDHVEKYLHKLEHLPRFVISAELLALARKEEATMSMLDMKRAGVLKLPFGACIVEYPLGKGQAIVLLRDLTQTREESWPWEANNYVDPIASEGPDYYGVAMKVENDEEGAYFVMSPSVIYESINYAKDAPPDFRERHPKEKAWLRMRAHLDEGLKDTTELQTLVEKTFQKDAAIVFSAACAAYLLMNTAGVAKEIVTCEKLNKARVRSGKSPIPEYTYLHIGRVYRSESSDESDEYVPHRSPRPHWRRGHVRGVRYGVGRQQIKRMYFPPKLVAYHGDIEPVVPNYMVTK